MFKHNRISFPAVIIGFLLGSFAYSCSSTKNNASVTIKNTPLGGWDAAFDKQGHRGSRGLLPENTIPAMLKALDHGVTTLEMDISFSKDKKAVLSHEPFFNHEITTKPDGGFIAKSEARSFNLYKMDYAEIAKFDVGMKAHPVFIEQEKIKAVKPLLADVFDAVKDYMISRKRPMPLFNIETKTTAATDNTFHPAPAEFVELLMKVIREKQMEEFVTIQSFDPRTLKYLHTRYPQVKTSLLVEASSRSSFRKQMNDLGFTPTVYSPNFLMVTDVLIKNCHDLNMKIIPWTVNDRKKIEELKKMGVDGIITDYPNLFND
jgi:glycerophosphoryl diester phosphodiesterase